MAERLDLVNDRATAAVHSQSQVPLHLEEEIYVRRQDEERQKQKEKKGERFLIKSLVCKCCFDN